MPHVMDLEAATHSLTPRDHVSTGCMVLILQESVHAQGGVDKSLPCSFLSTLTLISSESLPWS